MFSEDLGFLDFGSCFQKTKVSRSWLMFSEDQGFLECIIHANVRGPFTIVPAK